MSMPRFGRVLAHWSVGMAVATPLVAILQGSFLLSDYRINFKDAPRPITPASGMIAALAQQSQSTNNGDARLTTTDKPLRLLVIGDSLAAGVGVSGNGLPVLPESIAKALSKALGGRVVYWTCVGTPGISAAQIVHDINAMPKRQPRRFEQFVEELKTKREKWKQLQLMKMERLGDEEEESPAKQQGIVLKIVEWWKAEEKQPVSEFSKEIAESGAKWWKRTSRRIRQTVNDIQEVIHTTPDGIEGNSAADDSGQEVHNLVRKGNLFRRDSLDPNVASSFDVAVVLLGLNDIKEAFMPPMIHGANSSLNEGTKPTGGVLNSQLEKMFHALMGKMGKDNDADSTISTEGTQSITVPQKLHPPLVVVPELPVAPLEAFQLVPLCWLLLPLFRAMERNKKFLSSTFPNNVVFIKQPDLAWWSDAEKRHKSYKDDEEFIVKLTDIAQTAQTQVKQLMKRFYHPNNQKTGNKEESELVNGNGNQSPSESNAKESGVSVEGDQAVPSEQKSLYIAQDKIHPNDEGYDLFGQYIAEAVVRHWGRPQV